MHKLAMIIMPIAYLGGVWYVKVKVNVEHLIV